MASDSDCSIQQHDRCQQLAEQQRVTFDVVVVIDPPLQDDVTVTSHSAHPQCKRRRRLSHAYTQTHRRTDRQTERERERERSVFDGSRRNRKVWDFGMQSSRTLIRLLNIRKGQGIMRTDNLRIVQLSVTYGQGQSCTNAHCSIRQVTADILKLKKSLTST